MLHTHPSKVTWGHSLVMLQKAERSRYSSHPSGALKQADWDRVDDCRLLVPFYSNGAS